MTSTSGVKLIPFQLVTFPQITEEHEVLDVAHWSHTPRDNGEQKPKGTGFYQKTQAEGQTNLHHEEQVCWNCCSPLQMEAWL